MANAPEGFTYEVVGSAVVISHQGRRASTLRGAAAQRLLADLDGGDAQQVMARVTGNYKHGNERTAKNHPRNAGRQ